MVNYLEEHFYFLANKNQVILYILKKICNYLPSIFPLWFLRPSWPCELCPHDKTFPSSLRNKVCCSPQQMLVRTPGPVQDTGLRVAWTPNCPLELSPQQNICMSARRLTGATSGALLQLELLPSHNVGIIRLLL